MPEIKIINGFPFINYAKETYDANEMLQKAKAFMNGWTPEGQ